VSLLILQSCATLRQQKLVDKQLPEIRISQSGDERSLALLMSDRKKDLRLRRQSPSGTGTSQTGQLLVPSGTWCWIVEETSQHCKGRAVFAKVRIMDGANKDAEGWVCGAFVTHRKVAAL
jgi:hypothetical protein